MQHLLEKNGFVRCGIIHLANGAPRIAYQFAGDSTNYRGSNEQSQQNYDPQTPDQSWSVREVPSGGRGFGIASMVLGIISLVLFFSFVNIPLAILAIIFGIIQLTRKAPKGMAISGIVMGISSLFLLVIFWTCMFVSAARTESTDNSTYYYEGSENDDASGDYYDGYMRAISRDTKMAIMMATMATHRMKNSMVIHRMTASMVICRMMILIIFMGRTAYIINKEMTAGESV